MKIVCLDRATISASTRLPTPSFEHTWLSYDNTQAEQTIERLLQADIAITNKVVIDRKVLEACPTLKYIAVAATGVNVIDLPACKEHGVTVANVTGYATHAVAEHTFMMILALLKQLKAYQQTMMQGQWQAAKQFCYFVEGASISSLQGKCLGLIGTGAIAQATAALAKAFGMTASYFSPSGRADVDGLATVSLSELMANSDVVSIHCPLTEVTEQLINAQALALMKPKALLINTARGPIVDVPALLKALERGEIAGAGLDVLPQEPPSAESAIMAALDKANLLVTPHTAWASEEAMQALANQLMAKMEDFVAGRPVPSL